MSYNKHTWATGNVVGAVDLNRMEQGIEDASGGAEPLILEWDSETYTSNKTWQEVYNALASGVPCYERPTPSETNAEFRPIIRAFADTSESTYSIYVVYAAAAGESVAAYEYSTDAPNNYFED